MHYIIYVGYGYCTNTGTAYKVTGAVYRSMLAYIYRGKTKIPYFYIFISQF